MSALRGFLEKLTEGKWLGSYVFWCSVPLLLPLFALIYSLLLEFPVIFLLSALEVDPSSGTATWVLRSVMGLCVALSGVTIYYLNRTRAR